MKKIKVSRVEWLRSGNRVVLCLLLAALAGLGGARGQATPTPISVSTAAELTAAVSQAFANSQADGTALTTINLTADITGTAQMIVNANVVINGGGYTLDMNNADRAFFIAGGNVTINDLTISNGLAQGGDGAYFGGGGGAGLGGAIFVGSGTYLAWDGSKAASGISVPVVALNGVSFAGNSATGGDGGNGSVGGMSPWGSGGGGMGGNGGASTGADTSSGGGGGGGFGMGADGGSAFGSAGMAGAMVNLAGTGTSAGNGGNGDSGDGGAGGINGGGGGGGGDSGDFTWDTAGSGGGGGLGGEHGFYQNDQTPNNGGYGGFGGGGGGSSAYSGGNGGFGGGGGGTNAPGINGSTSGGTGGFGGGGGAAFDGTGGSGGFGAGSGVSSGPDGVGGGGGGLGAGGAIFVMNGAQLTVSGGSFSGSAVAGGVGYENGSAIGADLFLGGDVTLNVAGAMTLSSLGGAGNPNDPNVVNKASDPNAQGGVIKTGAGTVTLTGDSYYSGQTVVHNGTLALAAGAKEIGTSSTVVGVNSGDNATLLLTDGNDYWQSAPATALQIAQEAGSTGRVVIGSGGTSRGANIVLNVFTGGDGDASVVFQQLNDQAGSAVYEFRSTLTGSIQVVQDGPGTTMLLPQFGNNTYTGGTQVQQGTLQVGGTNALGTGGVTVTGGTLVVQGGSAITNEVTLGGGSYTVAVNAGGSYANMANATSSFGNGRATAASVLGGTVGAPSAGTTLATSFATASSAANDGLRLSDVYSFSGTGADIFVLQLSMTSVATGSYLGWLNTATNEWVNAVEGNTGNNATAAQQGFLGSYADFLTAYQGEQLADYIGAYGVDASTDPDTGTQTVTVWAVLNHNSDFAIVPEPSTWALLAAALLGAVVMALQRKAPGTARRSEKREDNTL